MNSQEEIGGVKGYKGRVDIRKEKYIIFVYSIEGNIRYRGIEVV